MPQFHKLKATIRNSNIKDKSYCFNPYINYRTLYTLKQLISLKKKLGKLKNSNITITISEKTLVNLIKLSQIQLMLFISTMTKKNILQIIFQELKKIVTIKKASNQFKSNIYALKTSFKILFDQ